MSSISAAWSVISASRRAPRPTSANPSERLASSLINPEPGVAESRRHPTTLEVETKAGGQDVIVPERGAIQML